MSSSSAAKVAQEKLIEASGIPYTMIRATQFLEFLGGIADSSTDGYIVRLPPVLFQPFGYCSAPDFWFRRDREAFPMHRHKMKPEARFVAPIQYRPNVRNSCRHASLKSRSGSTCLP